MKAKDIVVGKSYKARVSNKLVTVKVEEEHPNGGWIVVNTDTNRKLRFRTGAKFHGPASDKLSQDAKTPTNNVKLNSRLADRLRRKAPKYAFPPTEEQQAILDMATEAEGSGCRVIVVGAGAGTGKTATDVMLAQTLSGVGQYTAFNTNLVNEGKPKFAPTRCACNTTHSLAFRSVGKDYSHRLNGKRIKSSQVARMLGIHGDYEVELEPLDVGESEFDLPTPEATPKAKEKKKLELSPKLQAALVMGAIGKFCQSADKEVLPKHFRYVDGIDNPVDGKRTYDNNQELREHLLPYAHEAWKDLTSKDGQLPFQHDHYVKIWQLGDPVIAADYILLDEAQDTAPVMLDILAQQIKPERKVKPLILLVGDSAQQIYEWRGAVDALAAFPDAPRRFLSQSFRFGEAIAQVANLILSDLREPTELRLKGLETIPSRLAPLDDPACVLCRTNAMAISTLLNAIAAGKHPFLVGGGSDVASFVRASLDLQEGRSTDHPELACFGTWGEVQEYSKLEEGEDLKLMVKLIDEFGAKPILDALDGMPKEQDADMVISTAHKSKGRQWPSVKLAQDFPPRDKTGDPDLKLIYVACTRAQFVLDVSECPFFVGEGGMNVERIMQAQPTVEEAVLITQKAIEAKAIEDAAKAELAALEATTDTEDEAANEEAEAPKPVSGNGSPIDNTRFTWSRLKDGGWGIRGPKGSAGKNVTVVRKDGSTSQVNLGDSVWEDDEVSLYKI